jgi:hypothetical protein
MQHAGGNRSQAGRILGLSHVTLRAKLRSMETPCEKTTLPEGTEHEPPQEDGE